MVVLVEHIGLRIGAGQQGLLRDLLAYAVAGQVVGVAQSVLRYAIYVIAGYA